MHKYFSLFIIILIGLMSCEGPVRESDETEKGMTLEDSIAFLEDELFNASAMRIDQRKALELIKLYEQYTDAYPDKEDAPEYLFKAADLSMNIRRPRSTIALFDRILTEYPDDDKTPSALFLKAFVYEDQLQDYEHARINYELFLSEYPESEFADDAEVSLKNLGKSPEELIKEFEEKGQ